MDKKKYEVTETYFSSFDSFDWRANLIRMIRDFQLEAAQEILSEFPGDINVEWKDDSGIIDFAIENNLFDAINKRMKELADNYLFSN
jgi:hypothetical protein